MLGRSAVCAATIGSVASKLDLKQNTHAQNVLKCNCISIQPTKKKNKPTTTTKNF